jgi:hypothetical protein
MIAFQKQNYGFSDDDDIFKNQKAINNDLKYLVKFYFVMEIWLVINSVVTFVNAKIYSSQDFDYCNLWFINDKNLN